MYSSGPPGIDINFKTKKLTNESHILIKLNQLFLKSVNKIIIIFVIALHFKYCNISKYILF